MRVISPDWICIYHTLRKSKTETGQKKEAICTMALGFLLSKLILYEPRDRITHQEIVFLTAR